MTPQHVEVRMRDEDSASGYTFTHWPLDDLERLITLINFWGNPIEATGSGQLSYDIDGRWYFEVVMGSG